ncbi:MAG: DUF1080 domain-containing protein [Vicinamibacterales bacterium]
MSRRLMPLLVLVLGLYALQPLVAQQDGWTSLFDGKTLNGWNVVGDANWRVVDGYMEATSGGGYLVTPNAYGDFQMSVDFWVTPDANSGVFIRCADPMMITANNSYEVNIFDMRPDPKFRTGGIVNIASPTAMINAGNQWNTFVITAQGPKLTVVLNGTTVVDGVENTQFARGPIALQYGAGTVRFRNVRIRAL